MLYPIREKYVEEIVGDWFIFGIHPDGTVDISDGDRDVFTNLTPAKADYLVRLQNQFLEAIKFALCYDKAI